MSNSKPSNEDDKEQYARVITEVAYLGEIVKRAGRYIHEGNDTGVLVCLLLIQKSLEARIAEVARGLTQDRSSEWSKAFHEPWSMTHPPSWRATRQIRNTMSMSQDEIVNKVTRDIKQLWNSPDAEESPDTHDPHLRLVEDDEYPNYLDDE